jgi:DNA-binding PadR family transcriptional regulator
VSGRPLNATAASLLGFLLEGPKSGWDLVATAERRIGTFWSITRSQVYRELATMSDLGLIAPGETGPRERRPYRITPRGRAAFRAWLEADTGDEQIRHPLLLKLSFGRHLKPGRLAELLADERREHAARLDAYRERLPELEETDPYAAAVLQFGIRYEQAMLAWLDGLDLSSSSQAGRR